MNIDDDTTHTQDIVSGNLLYLVRGHSRTDFNEEITVLCGVAVSKGGRLFFSFFFLYSIRYRKICNSYFRK